MCALQLTGCCMPHERDWGVTHSRRPHDQRWQRPAASCGGAVTSGPPVAAHLTVLAGCGCLMGGWRGSCHSDWGGCSRLCTCIHNPILSSFLTANFPCAELADSGGRRSVIRSARHCGGHLLDHAAPVTRPQVQIQSQNHITFMTKTKKTSIFVPIKLRQTSIIVPVCPDPVQTQQPQHSAVLLRFAFRGLGVGSCSGSMRVMLGYGPASCCAFALHVTVDMYVTVLPALRPCSVPTYL